MFMDLFGSARGGKQPVTPLKATNSNAHYMIIYNIILYNSTWYMSGEKLPSWVNR